MKPRKITITLEDSADGLSVDMKTVFEPEFENEELAAAAEGILELSNATVIALDFMSRASEIVNEVGGDMEYEPGGGE